MQDLNKMYNMQHGMSRQHSYGSQMSELSSNAQATGMARSFTMPGGLQIIQEGGLDQEIQSATPTSGLPGADPFVRRQLRHQLSLDCIGSAIASATARRAGHQRTNSGLSQGYTAEQVPPMPSMPLMQDQKYPSNSVQLDDLDDIPDDYEDLPQPQPGYLHPQQQFGQQQKDGTPYSYSEHIQLHDTDYAEYEDESEDEVDLVLQAKQYESEEEHDPSGPLRAPLSPSTGYLRRDNALSPMKSAMKAVPPKSPSAARRLQTSTTPSADDTANASRPPSALGASARLSFGVASPASPVKKSYTPITSPPRRSTRTLAPRESSSSSGRSPRMTPASPASTSSSRVSASAAAKGRTKPSPVQNGDRSPVKKQQIERVPGPLSTPSVVRMQPMSGGMRKMASTSALRSSGM